MVVPIDLPGKGELQDQKLGRLVELLGSDETAHHDVEDQVADGAESPGMTSRITRHLTKDEQDTRQRRPRRALIERSRSAGVRYLSNGADLSRSTGFAPSSSSRSGLLRR